MNKSYTMLEHFINQAYVMIMYIPTLKLHVALLYYSQKKIETDIYKSPLFIEIILSNQMPKKNAPTSPSNIINITIHTTLLQYYYSIHELTSLLDSRGRRGLTCAGRCHTPPYITALALKYLEVHFHKMIHGQKCVIYHGCNRYNNSCAMSILLSIVKTQYSNLFEGLSCQASGMILRTSN